MEMLVFEIKDKLSQLNVSVSKYDPGLFYYFNATNLAF